MMLADLGAEVIKVERPGVGDPFRNFAGKAEAGQGPSGPAFHSYNRNKQSIAIDVSRPEGRDELIALVKTADVYLQNFRPGTVAKWNIGAEALRAVNPRLIYCAISGFGSDGPYAERPAFDTVAQAISGYLGLFVNPDDPVILGPAVADQITGLQSANAILAALFNRERTGKGRLVEMTMVGAMMYFTLEQFQKTFILGRPPARLDRARLSQSYAFRCADGLLLGVHLSSPPKFWQALLDATGANHLRDDPRFVDRDARVEHYLDVQREMQAVLATQPRAHWIERLERLDVPHGPILTLEETIADPQVRHLGLEVATHHPVEGPGRAIRRAAVFDGDRNIETRAAPMLDEHGPAIRAALKRVAP